MSLDPDRPRFRRRVVVIGSSGLLAAAGVAGGLAMLGRGSPAHAAGSPARVQVAAAQAATTPAPTADPAEAPTAPDTDTTQSGPQDGADGAAPAASNPEAPDATSDGPGGYADTGANAQTDQQGEH